MVKKFCKIIENEDGDQLLLQLMPSEEHEGTADLIFTFNIPGQGVVAVTMGGIEWKPAEEMLETYNEEAGRRVISDPLGFINSLRDYGNEQER